MHLTNLRRHTAPMQIFFKEEDGIRDDLVTGVQTCALPIFAPTGHPECQFRAAPVAPPRAQTQPVPRECRTGRRCARSPTRATRPPESSEQTRHHRRRNTHFALIPPPPRTPPSRCVVTVVPPSPAHPSPTHPTTCHLSLSVPSTPLIRLPAFQPQLLL